MLHAGDAEDLIQVARSLRPLLSSERDTEQKLGMLFDRVGALIAGLELIREQLPPPPNHFEQLAELWPQLEGERGAAALRRELSSLRRAVSGESSPQTRALLDLIVAIAGNAKADTSTRVRSMRVLASSARERLRAERSPS